MKLTYKFILSAVFYYSMKMAEKHNPNKWIYYDVKSTLNVSVSVTILRTWVLDSSHSDGCLLR